MGTRTRLMKVKVDRQAQVLKLAKNCIRYMKEKSLDLAKEGKTIPAFGIPELMNESLVPEDFELRWDVARGVVDAMKESITVGLVEKSYNSYHRGAYYKYKGPDLVRIQAQAQKIERAQKNEVRAAAKKHNVKIELHWHGTTHEVSMSVQDFLRLAKKKSR